jgi:hypothetical protein
MKRVWHTPAKVLTGLIVTALYAMPQATISARPGVINYIEGSAAMDGKAITGKANGKVFLNAGDTLSTDQGKAELLLTPGVFLRLGSDSEVKMISPSLTDTQVELTRGEALVDVDQLVKENNIQIADKGATVRLEKTGLYRFTADDPPTATTLEGKAEVIDGDKKVALKKNHETVLTAALKPEKTDTKKSEDDLYAWSKVRGEYVAAASFASAKTVNVNNYGYGFGGSGFGYGPYAPGWFWNPVWSSWAWLPGDGAFFSPFGYGFFAPQYIAYAPVIVAPLRGRPGTTAQVPVNPGHPGVTNAGIGHRPPIVTSTGMPYRNAPMPQMRASGHWSGAAMRSAPAGGAASGAGWSGRVGGGRGGAPAYHGSMPSSAGAMGRSAGSARR